jgi:hypothetical protein
MKKIIIYIFVIVSLISCSDKLTESKVEELLASCLETNPVIETSELITGKRLIGYELGTTELKKLVELEKQGYVKLVYSEEKKLITYQYCTITLTPKSSPYIISTLNIGDENHNKIKLYRNILDKVGTIQEVPAYNGAYVKITYKKVDTTPFFKHYSNDLNDKSEQRVSLKKTENKGWIYCEN